MAISKKNLCVLFKMPSYRESIDTYFKTLLLLPQIILHEKVLKYKWHNKTQQHLALYFRNNSENDEFWWHLKGWEKEEEWKGKKCSLNLMLFLISLRSLIFYSLQMLGNLGIKQIFPRNNKVRRTIIRVRSTEQIPCRWDCDMLNSSS